MHSPKHIEWTPEKASRFWAWQSQKSDDYFTNRFGGQIVARLRHHIRSARSVLDLGCGLGFLLPHLCRAGFETTGADTSREAVEISQRRAAGIPGFQGAMDIASLVESGRKFDAVLCIEVIEHLTDPELSELFQLAHHVLGQGGTAVFTTPNRENLALSEVFCAECGTISHRWQHMRTWDEDTLRGALQGGGFSSIETFTTNFALSARRAPITWTKRIVKRMIGRDLMDPHLVAVARV